MVITKSISVFILPIIFIIIIAENSNATSKLHVRSGLDSAFYRYVSLLF